MSDDISITNSCKSKNIEPADARITFLKKHELTALLKKVDKHTSKAVDTLSMLMDNEDTDDKVKADAAKFLLELRTKIGIEMSKDSLARTIAEVKLVQGIAPKTVGDVVDIENQDDDSVPLVDFSMIKSTK